MKKTCLNVGTNLTNIYHDPQFFRRWNDNHKYSARVSIFNLLADKYDRFLRAFRKAFSLIWWRVNASFGRKIRGESRTAKAVDFGSYWSPVRCLRTCFQCLPDDVKDRWQNKQIYGSLSHVDSFVFFCSGTDGVFTTDRTFHRIIERLTVKRTPMTIFKFLNRIK